MIRKYPVIQWNRQYAILFHETVPVKEQYFNPNPHTDYGLIDPFYFE
jgi:hypothetical protein